MCIRLDEMLLRVDRLHAALIRLILGVTHLKRIGGAELCAIFSPGRLISV